MASEAHKRMMKRIPKDIQRKVEFNLEVSDEIFMALENQGLKPVDLAKRLKKSESEISKWLTGTHNFTIKTIRKIELALGADILTTVSKKIDEYEARIFKLEEKCAELEKENNGLVVFNELAKIEGTLGKKLFSFNPNKEDKAKIKSDYKPHSLKFDYVDKTT